MTVLSLLSFIFGGVGVAYGIRCYVELRRWARQCQRARIVIAYNRRIQLDASLAEWLSWVNQLKGKEANGRTVYKVQKMSVSILKSGIEAKTTATTLRNSRRSRKDQVTA